MPFQRLCTTLRNGGNEEAENPKSCKSLHEMKCGVVNLVQGNPRGFDEFFAFRVHKMVYVLNQGLALQLLEPSLQCDAVSHGRLTKHSTSALEHRTYLM